MFDGMIGCLKGLDQRGLFAGLTVMTVLGMGIVVGSGNFRHYGPILLTYTFGVLFSPSPRGFSSAAKPLGGLRRCSSWGSP